MNIIEMKFTANRFGEMLRGELERENENGNNKVFEFNETECFLFEVTFLLCKSQPWE